MPKFPTKEADVASLAYTMIMGYFAHMSEFPSVSPLALFIKHRDYITARNARSEAAAAAQLATEAKNNALLSLSGLMKSCLKKSQVDVTNDQQKLAYIGWGPKAAAPPVAVPSQPNNLSSTAQVKGILWLKWNKPASGGIVRNYIIERRYQSTAGDEFGPWSIAGSALNNEINLKNQPRGIQLEYRIKAINTGGESNPSNTISVVL